jgi:hypothetical protein
MPSPMTGFPQRSTLLSPNCSTGLTITRSRQSLCEKENPCYILPIRRIEAALATRRRRGERMHLGDLSRSGRLERNLRPGNRISLSESAVTH